MPDKTYFRIGEVSKLLGVQAYVLRFWETEFPMVIPQKSAANQRVYRRPDVERLLLIKHLLYEEKYSIAGARRRIMKLGRRLPPEGGELAQIKALAKDLKSLAATPISSLFRAS